MLICGTARESHIDLRSHKEPPAPEDLPSRDSVRIKLLHRFVFGLHTTLRTRALLVSQMERGRICNSVEGSTRNDSEERRREEETINNHQEMSLEERNT